MYVFAGDHVWRYRNGGRAPDQGFPRPITAEFPGTFARNLDAALVTTLVLYLLILTGVAVLGGYAAFRRRSRGA